MGRKNNRKTSQERALESGLRDILAYGNYNSGLNKSPEGTFVNKDVEAEAKGIKE